MSRNGTLLIFEPHAVRARLYVARTSGLATNVLLARSIEDFDRFQNASITLCFVSIAEDERVRVRQLTSIRKSYAGVATYVLDTRTYRQEDFVEIALVGHVVRSQSGLSTIIQQLEQLL